MIRKISRNIPQSKYEIRKKILFLATLMSFSITTVFAQEWTQISKPQKGDIRHLHINKINPNTIYAVTFSEIYKTTDNGTTWNVVFTSSGISDIFAIAPNDDNIIYSEKWKSTDGGNTWQAITPIPCQGDAYSVHRIAINPTNPDVIFSGDLKTIKKTTDGGQSWHEVFSGSFFNIHQIAYNDLDNNILYAMNWGEVYKSVNGGVTWTRVYFTLKNFRGLEIHQGILYSSDATSDDNYSPLVSSKCLLKSTDGGVTWTELPLNNSNYDIGRITDFKIIDGIIYATTLKGLYSSNDLGATWSKTSSDYDHCRAVDANSTKIVLGGRSNGVSIANKSDMIFKNVGVEPLSIYFTSLKTNNTNAIVCGESGTIYKYESVGNYWKSIAPSSGDVTPFFSKTSGKLFSIIGYDLYSSTDIGANWTYLCQLPYSTVSGVDATVSSDEQKIFISTTSTIMYSLNSGNSWGIISIPGTSIYDIHYSSSDVLYLLDNTGYYYSLNNGTTWQSLNGLSGNYTISSRKISYNNINDDKLYVGLSNGAVYIKEYGATNWTQIYQGVISETPWIVGKICNSVDGAKLYAYGYDWNDGGYDGLYYSNDDGVSWKRYSTEFNFSSSYYYTMPNNEIWHMESNGNIWVSDGNSIIETYTISGSVTFNGNPLAGVTITYNGGSSVLTNSSGQYSIIVDEGSTVTLTPSFEGYDFTPPSITCSNVTNNLPNQNFTAQLEFVPVSNITGIPTTATATFSLTLNGIVVPSNATNQTIIWSIQNAGTTGATINSDNILNTSGSGTVILLATIENGASPTTNYTQSFSIIINKATQDAPPAPTLNNCTPTSITLNAVSGCEYNINNGTYQSSPTFAELTPNTTYGFTQRKAETISHQASPTSLPAYFSTDDTENPIYTIVSTVNNTEYGTITPYGEAQVEEGNDITFTITTYPGFIIEDVLVDGVSKGAINSYSFENVQNDGTINAILTTYVGITENSLWGIMVYPNPTSGELQIEGNELKIEKVEIVDIAGKLLSSHHLVTAFPNHKIDISHLKSGAYLLRIETQSGIITHKIIKK